MKVKEQFVIPLVETVLILNKDRICGVSGGELVGEEEGYDIDSD